MKKLVRGFIEFVIPSVYKRSNDQSREPKVKYATIKHRSSKEEEFKPLTIIIFDEKGRIINEKMPFHNIYNMFIGYGKRKIAFRRGSNKTIYSLDGHERIVKSNTDFNSLIYNYNADGYLIKIIDKHSGNVVYDFIWQNGNLIEISNNATTEITIVYGDDMISDKYLEYRIYSTIYPNGYIADYFGKISKKAPFQFTTRGGVRTNFSYIKDDNGNIIGIETTVHFGINECWSEIIVDYNNLNQ